MAATSTLVRYEELDIHERSAIAGFLAGYSGNPRVSYTTDLRLFAAWCADNRLRVLDVRRAHLETFARTMEQEGRMRSTVARRLSTLCSFYRYCHLEGLLARNPAANVRRPKVGPQARTLGLDRNELGALLVQAGLGSPRDHALISLLAMNGLRISEALGRRHRRSGRRPRASNLAGHAQGRQAGHHPARAAHRSSPRSLHRRTSFRADLPGRRRGSDGPLRRRPHRETAGPSGRDHQADLTPQPAPLVHHRRP